jgi:hypothetical protein
MPDVVVAVGTLFKVQKRARISGKNRGDVLQCARITNLSNSLAKRPQRFSRDSTQAQPSTVTQFPKGLVDIRRKRIST